MRTLPKAQTMKSGSYRYIEGPDQAVLVRHSPKRDADTENMSGTDWMLLFMDAGWEKAENAYYQGLEEGYAMGLQEGLHQGRCEAEKTADCFTETLTNLESRLMKYYDGVERWAVKLAMKIAEKVIAQAASENKNLVEQTVRKAIAETADKSRIVIKVNPSDYEALKEFKTSVTALSEGIEHFRMESDAGITPGSCRVETPSGLLDADFTTQIGELRRALILQEEAKV